MNSNQVNGIIRAVLPAILAYAVGRGWITNDQVGEITTAVVTIVMAGWSVVTNIEGPKA